MPSKPGFNAKQDHLVRKELKFNGRLFKEGVVFPWRTVGCSVRKLRLMYQSGKLYYKTDEEELLNEEENIDLDSVSEVVSDDSNTSDEDSNELDQEDESEISSGDDSDESDDSEDKDTSEDNEDEGKDEKSSKRELPKPKRRRTKRSS